MTAQRPVQTGPTSFEIHGTAVAPAGGQLPLDQIEQRLVTSTANAFAVNGKRTIRADSTGTQQGTLSYDSATSTRWTAKYTASAPPTSAAPWVRSPAPSGSAASRSSARS